MAQRPRFATLTQYLELKLDQKLYYLFSEELDLTVLHLESLLDESSQFTDTLCLLAEDILGSRSQNNNLSSLWGDSHFDSGVTIFGQFLIYVIFTIYNKLVPTFRRNPSSSALKTPSATCFLFFEMLADACAIVSVYLSKYIQY